MKELLVGKVAVITGSGRGIGKATAELFLEQGGKVVINDIDSAPVADTVKEFTSKGYDVLGYTADVTNHDQVRKMMESAITKWGKIDILVNNAGVTRDAMVHKMDDDLFRFIIKVNLKSTYVCTQAVMPEFLKPERKDEFKKIVNFSSTAGISGNVGQANYAAAKAAIVAYTKSCAREFSQDRICINAIAPGTIETRMTQEKKPGEEMGIPAAIRSIAINAIPFSRNGIAGLPRDIARIVLFFSSDLSDWVTGQVLIGDGAAYI
jgi:3-oxoacyl-[acyl-carrier protein] reductase